MQLVRLICSVAKLTALAYCCWLLGTMVPADARPRGASQAAAVTGRVVQNGFSNTGAFTYANFFKSWGTAGSISINGNNLATSLNANGFPNGTLSNNLGGSLFLPPDIFLGPVRMKWTGTLGGLVVGLGMTASSGGSFLSGSTFSGVNGDVTFTINALTTSATSNTIGLGNLTFTVGAGLGLSPNEVLTIAQTSSLTNYMVATVVSYSGTTLVANVNSVYGSGTFSSWNIWRAPNETNSYFPSGVANSSLSSIILCRDQDYATIAAGGQDSYFYHKFLSVISAENPQILRMMGETLNSGSEMLTNPLSAYNKPLASMSWSSSFTYPPSAYAGNSSGVDSLSTGSYSNMPGSWTDKETFQFNTPANTVTITIASPARLSLPKSVVPGEVITLRTTGALPTGLTASTGGSGQNTYSVRGNATFYYALDSGSTNIRIAATPGGTAINTTGTQSGTHSMGPTTARVITAVANNGSNIPRLTLLSTSGLTTNDIVQVSMGNIGAFRITVINGTDIDLTTSYPSGAALPCGGASCTSNPGQTWSTQTGYSPITDPASPGNGDGRSYLTTTSINVGSRGAKPVVGTQGVPLPPGNLAIEGSNYGGINTCTFDAPGDFVMCGPGGLYAYVMPLELQVALANKLNKHLWYQVGVAVSDAKVTADIQYIAANLNPQLKLFFAYSNETWNNAFTQYFYLWRYGIANNYAYNNSGNVQQNYTATGIRTIQVMALASSAWTGAGRSAATLRRVISLQAAAPQSLMQTYLLNGNDLPGPNNAAPNRPVDKADVGTWANYWNGVLINSQYAGTTLQYAGLTTAASDYASGVPASMSAALTWVYNDVMGLNGTARPTGTTDFSVNSQINTGGTNAGYAVGWESVFASYDATRASNGQAPLDMVAYEGGPGLRAPSVGECSNLGISASCTDIATLITAFKNDTISSSMIVAAQSAFVNPSSFPHTKNGSFLQLEGPNEWSLLPGNFFSRPYQMYNGATLYNQ